MSAETAIMLHEPKPVDAYRMSTDAAGICKEIVVATASNIQGRKFVSVEGWQAVAIAHNCAAGARDVERVDGGVRAIGEVRRMSDGQVISTAEGFVGEDEPTWFGGTHRGKTLPKRADYAIRAMAQTRAISRACRSAFAHVVVMMNAGLSTTPAEEVPAEGFNPETGEIIDARAEKLPGISKIKQTLNKLMLDGNNVQDLAKFNALVRDCSDELTKIKEGNHDYWTGDGEDHEGFKAWIIRRRAELTPQPESLTYQLLVSTLDEVTALGELKAWLGHNCNKIGDLDGEESRRFTEIYDLKEAAINALEQVTTGA